MQKAGFPKTPRRSVEKSDRIIRAGDITSSVVVVGDNNLLSINAEGTAIIHRVAPDELPEIRRRPSPVIIGRPRRSVSFLDREAELETVHEALQTCQLLELVGKDGIGKTTLLRAICSQYQLADGVALFDKGLLLADILQELFESFYESNRPYRPTPAEFKRRFENIQALILIDNYILHREETQVLLDTLPKCSIIVASEERQIWENSCSIEINGLPLDAAMALVEREAGRKLTPKEIPAVRSICSSLDGHPLRLRQMAALATSENITFDHISRQISEDSSGKSVFSGFMARLTKSEKSILALLANFGAFTDTTIKELAVSPDIPDATIELEKLKNLGLVKEDNNLYQPTDRIPLAIQQELDTIQSVEDTYSYYADWSRRERTPEEAVLETGAIIKTLELLSNSKRWEKVLNLAREVSDVFYSQRKVGILKKIMEIALEASQQLGDKTSQAWALELLGVSELALGNSILARAYLSQTLQLQQSTGDKDGAARTKESLSNLRLLSVFLCHSSADKPKVVTLYHQLRDEGFDPWLDKENLLPGQVWQEEIPKALRKSDVVLVCLSQNAVTKAGYVQKEIKYALDKADEQPEGTIFIIPLKLEECDVPSRLSKWQWVNLFEERGYEKLIESLKLRAKNVGAG